MDYLTTQARGAAPSLLVISRYLSSAGAGGQTSEQLQQALRPPQICDEVSLQAGMLGPALRIGKHLGLFEQEKVGREETWRLAPGFKEAQPNDLLQDDRKFYSRVFVALNARALADVEANDLSDLTLGIIWFSQRDPLTLLNSTWNGETESVVKRAGIRTDAIYNSSQWVPFRRWAINLGVARQIERNAKTSFIAPDCTRAVESVLEEMPVIAEAHRWIGQLLTTLPVLGHPRLVGILPIPPREPGMITGSLALALLKLDRLNKITLVRSADAASTVVIQVGDKMTRIGEIRVTEVTAA